MAARLSELWAFSSAGLFWARAKWSWTGMACRERRLLLPAPPLGVVPIKKKAARGRCDPISRPLVYYQGNTKGIYYLFSANSAFLLSSFLLRIYFVLFLHTAKTPSSQCLVSPPSTLSRLPGRLLARSLGKSRRQFVPPLPPNRPRSPRSFRYKSLAANSGNGSSLSSLSATQLGAHAIKGLCNPRLDTEHVGS